MIDKKTYINVGKNGTFTPSGDSNFDTLPSDVDNAIELLKLNNQRKIGFYFHGGLVSDNAGINAAQIMNTQIKEAGLHPISFVWETGLFEILRDRFKDIGRESLFRTAKKIIINRLLNRLPTTKGQKLFKNISIPQIEIELKRKYPFENFEIEANELEKLRDDYRDLSDEEIIENIQKEIELDVERHPKLIDNLDFEELKYLRFEYKFIEKETLDEEKALLGAFYWGLAKITYKVIKRYWRKTNHSFYATVIEEVLRRYYVAKIGSSIWKKIKDKSIDMWNSNEHRTGKNLYAGTYLLTKLNELGTKESPIIIDAIGHSAGSIAICNLIKEVANYYPNIKVNNLIFLAPACRSDLFYSEVLQKRDRFNEIRIFTMSDNFEIKDRLVDGYGIIYPHSLLYFISGILEDYGREPDAHILGLERHINWRKYMKFRYLKYINRYLNEPGKNRLVLSKTTLNNTGLSSEAVDHGKFDNDDETLKSIKFILKNGLN